MLGDAMRMFGYNVTTASGGAEALRPVSAVPPDLILLDLKLPGMPGMEVLKHLRAEYPRLPVVISSGDRDVEVKRQLEAGAFDYVTKPFTSPT
jgi:CheY-like chemotaxis protein